MNAPHASLHERIVNAHISAFGGGYCGPANAPAVILYSGSPSEQQRHALVASFEQLGYQEGALGWINIDAAGEGEPAPDLLFNLIEAIDPLCVVALNHAATAQLSRSYHAPLSLETRGLLLGRECRCFENFEALLATEAGKRKAWGLLKTLPRNA